MELWIRSQDKTKLIKINFIEYGKYNNIHFINGFSTNGVDNYDLGIYKSKERALEVLNEIHQRLINLQCLEFNCITDTMRKQGMDCVYEMPKE